MNFTGHDTRRLRGKTLAVEGEGSSGIKKAQNVFSHANQRQTKAYSGNRDCNTAKLALFNLEGKVTRPEVE